MDFSPSVVGIFGGTRIVMQRSPATAVHTHSGCSIRGYMVNPSFIHGWRGTIGVLLLLLIVVGGSQASAQTPAAPAGTCPDTGGTPAAQQATPADLGATPATGTPTSLTQEASIVDQASLVDALRACGVDVEESGAVQQPFFTPESGTLLRLSGGNLSQPADIQVFEYKDAGGADADAEQIGPDGNPATMMIHWIAPPHFFRGERVIVLYIGEDQAALDLLTALLGPPFAGN